MDGRRRQYVPVSVHIAQSRTGRRLLKRFGTNGLLVWVLVLAAAKRATEQGMFRYDSEQDGWERLGLAGHQPRFSLKEFFDYTGRMHNTRRNDQKTIEIRAWNEWNSSIRHELDVEQKRRKRAQSRAPLGGTEVEVEVDKEQIERNKSAARQLHADLADRLGRAAT